jgi:hypothetical protein
MVTDTAFFRNPHYHLPTDTTDSLDFTFMAELEIRSGVERHKPRVLLPPSDKPCEELESGAQQRYFANAMPARKNAMRICSENRPSTVSMIMSPNLREFGS